MVRVYIGDGWRADPDVRRALAALEPSRSGAIRSIVDVLAIEVDDVDIAGGLTEAPVAEMAASLVAAVHRLAAGAPHATVSFPDGAVDLLLRRRDGNALLSIVTVGRPSRVVAHDVEVDLDALANGIRRAVADWCRSVGEVSPRAGEAPELRRLLRAASRRVRPRSSVLVTPPDAPRSRRPPRARSAPVCSFELHDPDGRLAAWRGPGSDLASLLVPGRVSLRSAEGRDLLSLEGMPFLLLRDLCAAAERIVAARGGSPVRFALARTGRRPPLEVVVDPSSGTIAADGALAGRCDPLALARAILEGAADLCAVVVSRAPHQEGNGRLGDLRDGARAGLAHLREVEEGDRSGSRRRLRGAARRPASPSPLAPGAMRRVSFASSPVADIGPPASAPVHVAGGRAVLGGERLTACLELASGAIAWRGPGARLACAAGDSTILAKGDAVHGMATETGRPVWSRPCPDGLRPGALLAMAGARVALVSGGSVTALEIATGRTAWTFESPGAVRLAALRVGPLLVVASDAGLVHALDANGRVEWRLRGPGEPCAAPASSGGAACFLFRSPVGASLAVVEGASGRRLGVASLDLSPASPAVPFAGRLAVAGSVGGDPVVVAVEPDGTPAWTCAAPGPGRLALAPAPGGLLVRSGDGSCTLLDRNGATRWSWPGRSGARAAAGDLPPVAARGLVLVPGEEVDVLDLEGGRPVGRLPGPAPACLHVTDRLEVVALDADGLATLHRVRSHLSLVG